MIVLVQDNYAINLGGDCWAKGLCIVDSLFLGLVCCHGPSGPIDCIGACGFGLGLLV